MYRASREAVSVKIFQQTKRDSQGYLDIRKRTFVGASACVPATTTTPTVLGNLYPCIRARYTKGACT